MKRVLVVSLVVSLLGCGEKINDDSTYNGSDFVKLEFVSELTDPDDYDQCCFVTALITHTGSEGDPAVPIAPNEGWDEGSWSAKMRNGDELPLPIPYWGNPPVTRMVEPGQTLEVTFRYTLRDQDDVRDVRPEHDGFLEHLTYTWSDDNLDGFYGTVTASIFRENNQRDVTFDPPCNRCMVP